MNVSASMARLPGALCEDFCARSKSNAGSCWPFVWRWGVRSTAQEASAEIVVWRRGSCCRDVWGAPGLDLDVSLDVADRTPVVGSR